jgi:uncharacterized protein YbjT (DUF2867 family)
VVRQFRATMSGTEEHRLRILVTGATGYLGGRLVPLLLERGHDVRCFSRRPEKLGAVPWADRVEIARGDALELDDVREAVESVDVVYYLVHSIGTGASFAASDRRAAENLAIAASEARVQRIVYLGGLVPAGDRADASEHLASRAEVGQILLDGAVPTIVLQAGVVIGSGSASFEMLRYLTERLPVMVTPKWVRSRVQPIAVRDVLGYLVGVLDLPPDTNRRYDIGGPDILTYEEMMQRYARVAGLPRRVIVAVPVLTPWLSSHWVNVVTPVPKALAQPLVESLRNSVVVRDHDIESLVPLDLLGFDEAVEKALLKISEFDVTTRWSDADWPGVPSDPMPTDPEWAGGTVYRDEREVAIDAPERDVWRVVEGIGGERGWYSFPLAWATRGLLDRLVGGVGLRRGRRHPDTISVGESLDFWRVEALRRPELLRLRAEMRLPGLAWLEFSLTDDDPERTVLHQRALFVPHGLSGHLYWWSVWPFHGIVFGSMLHRIAAEATRATTAT